jgi:hypothetical protein
MGDLLLHSIEAKDYGKGVIDGDRNDGGGEEHRRVSKSIEGWASFTGLR